MREYIRIFNNDNNDKKENVVIKPEKYVNKSSQADAYYFSSQRDSIVFTDIENPDDPTYPFKKKEPAPVHEVFEREDNNIKIDDDFEQQPYSPDFSLDDFDYEPEVVEDGEEIADEMPLADDEEVVFDDIYNFDDVDMAVAAMVGDEDIIEEEDESIEEEAEDVLPDIDESEVEADAIEDEPEETAVDEPVFFDIEGERPDSEDKELHDEGIKEYDGPSITIGYSADPDDDIIFEDIDNSGDADVPVVAEVPEEITDEVNEEESFEEPVIDEAPEEEVIEDAADEENFEADLEDEDDIIFEDVDNTVLEVDEQADIAADISVVVPVVDTPEDAIVEEPVYKEAVFEAAYEDSDDTDDDEFDFVTVDNTVDEKVSDDDKNEDIAVPVAETKEPLIDLAEDNVDENASFSSVSDEEEVSEKRSSKNSDNGDNDMSGNNSKKSKKRVIFWIIIAAAAAVIVFCLLNLFGYFAEADKQQAVHDELSAYTVIDDDMNKNEIISIAEEDITFETGHFGDEIYYYDPMVNDYYYQLAYRDVAAISEKYPDVTAWLYIPGTQISYPVMSSEGNEYLYTNYKGDSVSSGSLFIIEPLSFSPQNDNVVIHGHNMKSGMMFGSLKAFWLEEEMWTGNNILYIDIDGETQKYQIFSMYIEDMSANPLPTDFATDEEKVEYFNACAGKSKYHSTVTFDNDDKIITLSTCTNLENAGDNDRLLIQAKLLD